MVNSARLVNSTGKIVCTNIFRKICNSIKDEYIFRISIPITEIKTKRKYEINYFQSVRGVEKT